MKKVILSALMVAVVSSAFADTVPFIISSLNDSGWMCRNGSREEDIIKRYDHNFRDCIWEKEEYITFQSSFRKTYLFWYNSEITGKKMYLNIDSVLGAGKLVVSEHPAVFEMINVFDEQDHIVYALTLRTRENLTVTAHSRYDIGVKMPISYFDTDLTGEVGGDYYGALFVTNKPQ